MQNKFDANSTRQCKECDEHIKISFGGEANWQAHLAGEKHRRAAAAAAIVKGSRPITNFFKKVVGPIAPSPAPTAPQVPQLLPSAIDGVLSEPTGYGVSSIGPIYSIAHDWLTISIELSESADGEVITTHTSTLNESPSSSTIHAPLARKLHAAITRLPTAVPIGTYHDTISQFTVPVRQAIPADEDAWEAIDSILNNFLGYGKTLNDISLLVRRGPLGMDGLCSWIDSCASDLGISEALLEGKVGRLIEALELLYVLFHLLITMPF